MAIRDRIVELRRVRAGGLHGAEGTEGGGTMTEQKAGAGHCGRDSLSVEDVGWDSRAEGGRSGFRCKACGWWAIETTVVGGHRSFIHTKPVVEDLPKV